MLAPTAPHSLLSYRDLQAQGIHLTTTVVDGDKAIEFRRNGEILTLAKRSTNGLYNVKISCWCRETQSMLQANTVSSHPHPLPQDQVPAGPGDLKRLVEPKAATLRLVELTAATLAEPKATTMVEPMATILSQNHSTNVAVCTNVPSKLRLWHGCLGHPGAMLLRWMIPLLEGHNLHTSDVEKIGACGAYM